MGIGRAIVATIGLLAVAGCAPSRAPEGAAGSSAPALVVATIFPVANLTQRLAGDAAKVETLLPAGQSAHTFQLDATQAAAISDAALIVRVGPGADDWLDNALATSKAPVVTLMDHTELIHGATDHAEEHEHEGHSHAAHAANPHIWLDPIRARDDLAPAIADALGEVLPGQADAIRRRLLELQDSLTKLDAELREQLKPAAGTSYVTVHPAFTYFDARYGLRLAATVQELPGAEPSLAWMKQVVDTVRATGAKAVFSEAQLSTRAADALRNDLGLRTGRLDPTGGPNVPGRDSYEALLRYNAQQFAEALGP